MPVSRLSDPGHEGGTFYIGRSGKRLVIIGVQADRSDPSGEREVIFHRGWA